jgi:GPI mannosyltransferase 3
VTLRSQVICCAEVATSEESVARRTDEPSRVWWGVILLVAAVPRVWLAVFEHGMIWADEIYQSVEQAHRLAFGYGFIPWEFGQGARSWLFPGVLAGLLKAASWLGADSGIALVAIAKLAMAALSVLAVYLAMRLAKLLGTPSSALIAGVLGATFPVLVIYGSRCYSENVSAVIIVGIAYLLVRRSPRDAMIAGALTGLSVFLRYANAPLAVGFFALLVASRRWRDLYRFVTAGAVVALAGGVLDYFTWGRPFHSLFVYFQAGTSTDGYTRGVLTGDPAALNYLDIGWATCRLTVIPVALGLVAGWRRGGALALIGIGFLGFLSALRHKELRFVIPVLPLLIAIAGARLGALWDRIPRSGFWNRARPFALLAISIVLAGYCGHRIANVTLPQLGYYWGRLNPWRTYGVNRLLVRAAEEPELCGVGLLHSPMPMVGGYSYLHRDVYVGWMWDEPSSARVMPSVNALITHSKYADPLPADYTEVARSGGHILYLRPGGCAPEPPPDFVSVTRRTPLVPH